jgi:hypothetical protein
MTIDLQPIQPPVLFLPSHTGAFDVLTQDDKLLGHPPHITRGREGDFEYAAAEERGLRYRVYRRHPLAKPEALLAQDAQRYLTLPPQLPQRVENLARSWAAEAREPREIAKRIEHTLRTQYVYDLESPSGSAPNPLDHFLFESRRGHCEYYSTSMAIMLRTLGVPTRNVTGFIGGTYNRFGNFYAVRQGDAHSWVEAYIPDSGWTQFDPTPTSESAPRAEIDGLVATLRDLLEATGERWNRHVVGYDLDQQMGLLRDVRRGWPASATFSNMPALRTWLLMALFVAAGFALLWRLRRRRRRLAPSSEAQQSQDTQRVVALYQQLEEVLRVHGVPRRADTPPLSHALSLESSGFPMAKEVLSLTEIYLESRFGNTPLDDGAALDYSRRVRALRRWQQAA